MFITPVERLITALKTILDVPVSTRVPPQHTPLFVRLDPAAPKSTSVVTDDSLMAVQVYGDDQEDVINLAGALRVFLMDEVYASDPKILWWSEQAGPHEFPDPDTPDIFRWQITGILTTTLT